MRKTVKEFVKKEEIEVCDICGSENCPISWSWSVNCPYDNCFEDWGKAKFCSVDHFLEGIKQAKLGIDSKEDFNRVSFTLDMEGEGVSELTEFLSRLEKVK